MIYAIIYHMKKVVIYTDGASKGNPGVGGIGIVLMYKDKDGKVHTKEINKAFENVTNNQMELEAVIEAISALKEPCEIELHSDSKYIVDAFNEGWVDDWVSTDFRRGKKDEVKNIDKWEKLLSLIKDHKIDFQWVKGHAGEEYNERCDELANIAIKEKKF